MDLIKDILDEMDGRMENIKIFYPFLQIHRNLNNNKREHEYDISAMCLAVLSFLIYEGRLKYKGVTLTEIIGFLKQFVKEAYNDYIDEAESKDFASLVLDKLQNEGSNFLYQYYSYTIGDYRQKILKLIEMKIDDNNNTLYYYITKEGLDFFLKTKEFPEETQITINLLLFRKQIEKGSFDFALETVKRLNIEVQRKIEKKNWILELMMYGGKEGAVAYREYHSSAMLQFQEENELFRDVSALLRNVHQEYIEKISKNIITEKETKAFTVLKQIEQEMNRAMQNHTKLLKEAASLTKEYDNILKLRTKAAFSERFNFEGELEKVVSKVNHPAYLKYIIEPLFAADTKKFFNVLKVFEPQKVLSNVKKDSYEESEDAIKIERETIDDIVRGRVYSNFKIYASHMLKMFNNHKEFNLRDWSNKLKTDYGEKAIANGDFISFIIQLNHGKATGTTIKCFNIREIETQPIEKLSDIETIFKEVINDCGIDIGYNMVEVESIPDEDVDMDWGIKITNLVFRGV